MRRSQVGRHDHWCVRLIAAGAAAVAAARGAAEAEAVHAPNAWGVRDPSTLLRTHLSLAPGLSLTHAHTRTHTRTRIFRFLRRLAGTPSGAVLATPLSEVTQTIDLVNNSIAGGAMSMRLRVVWQVGSTKKKKTVEVKDIQ